MTRLTVATCLAGVVAFAGCVDRAPQAAYPGAPPADIGQPHVSVAIARLESLGFTDVRPLPPGPDGALRFDARILCGPPGPRDEPRPPCPGPGAPAPVAVLLRMHPLDGRVLIGTDRRPWPGPPPGLPPVLVDSYAIADPQLARECCALTP